MNSLEFAKEVEELAEFLLVSRGYFPIAANKKIAGVEVDRIFECANGDWVVCEIKAISDWRYLDVRVRPFQKQRLLKARQWLESYKAPGEVHLHYAYVHYDDAELRLYNHAGDEIEVIQGGWEDLEEMDDGEDDDELSY